MQKNRDNVGFLHSIKVHPTNKCSVLVIVEGEMVYLVIANKVGLQRFVVVHEQRLEQDLLGYWYYIF